MPLDIFPFQEVGGAYLAQRQRAGLLDEMGCGKTAQAIRALDLRRLKRGIIICPAVLRENWRGEFEKFAHIQRRICKGTTIHDFVAWAKGKFDVLITSYEMATKWAPKIASLGEILEFCIIDEAHYLKSKEAGRTKAVLGPDCDGSGIVMWCEQSWWLTGTAIPNDPIDIYTFLRFANVMPLSIEQFRKRYFSSRPKAFGSVQTPLANMVPELQKLIGNHSIRRVKKEIGVELPPIFLTSALVDGDSTEIRELLAMHPGLERSVMSAVQAGGLSFLDAQYVATLRRLVGEAKAIPYAHMLLEELDAGLDKRVVMGLHRKALMDVRDILTRRGYHAVLVNGDTPENERQAAVKAFQTDPRCKVFIGNIKAAGVGLTLTAANTLDMMESDWTPAGNAQAIMRIHRLGQTRNVTGRFITLARSIDETVNRVVREKTAVIADIEGSAMNAAPAA